MTTDRILIAYATRHGQARKVADHLARELTLWGYPTAVVDVARTPAIDWEDYGAAILVASVYGGRHEKEMVAFVRRGHAGLERIPNAFLSVTLSEATAEDQTVPEPKRREAAVAVQHVIDAFVKESGWRPQQVVPVAGALQYRQYNFFVRFIMKRITKSHQGPTDTSRDYEYTDWAALSRFATLFTRSLARPKTA
jgi:menaquinone-dependent protoporphyrinogen oxidase